MNFNFAIIRDRVTVVGFTVRGSGIFPFDMLRFESAFPTWQTESHKLETHVEERDVRLTRHTRNTGVAALPTWARWESFGWKVVAVHFPAGADLSEEGLRQLKP